MGLAMVIALLLTEPLVEFGSKVNRQWAAGKVIGALKATKLASDVAVKSGIYKPMWRVRQLGAGGSKGCLGVGCWC